MILLPACLCVVPEDASPRCNCPRQSAPGLYSIGARLRSIVLSIWHDGQPANRSLPLRLNARFLAPIGTVVLPALRSPRSIGRKIVSAGDKDIGDTLVRSACHGLALRCAARTETRPEDRHARVQCCARRGLIFGLIAGKVLWFATGYIALPDLMTLAGPLARRSLCAGQWLTDPIKRRQIASAASACHFVSVLAGQLLFVLLRSYSPRGDLEREWLGRAAGWYVVVALGWVVGATLVLFASAAAAGASLIGGDLQNWLAPLGGVSGALAALLGKSSATPSRGRPTGWQGMAVNLGLSVAAAVFGAVIVIASSILIDQIVFGEPLQSTLRSNTSPAWSNVPISTR